MTIVVVGGGIGPAQSFDNNGINLCSQGALLPVVYNHAAFQV